MIGLLTERGHYMIVVCMGGSDFVELSFDSGKPVSSIFSPNLSEAEVNINVL